MDAVLDNILLNLDHTVYNRLLKLGEIFDDSFEPSPALERKSLMPKAKKVGSLLLKVDAQEQAWKNYFAVYSVGYVYFFKDTKSQYPEFYHYLRKPTYQLLDSESQSFIYKLAKGSTELTVAWEKEAQKSEWLSILQAEPYSEHQGEAEEALNPNQIQMDLNVAIQSLSLNLVKSQRVFAMFATTSLSFSMQQRLYEQAIQVKIQQFYLEDYVRVYLNPELNSFIRTKSGEDALINVSLRTFDKKSPHYTHTDSIIECYFGSLLINCKSETIQHILELVAPEAEPN